MIEFSELIRDYGRERALGPVGGVLAEGGITALIGPNGSGKSTLLSMLGRLLAPTSGEILVDGREITRIRPAELATRLSILRQDNQPAARLSVRDLVGIGRFPYSKGRLTAEDREHVEAALEFMSMTSLADRFIDELSGGQRQRAFISMVLAQDTKYVFLDEPLNNLDPKHAVQTMQRLREAANALEKTIVLIIHDVNFAGAYADRIIALRDGQISHTGEAAEIMTGEVLSEVFDTPIRVLELDGQPVAIFPR